MVESPAETLLLGMRRFILLLALVATPLLGQGTVRRLGAKVPPGKSTPQTGVPAPVVPGQQAITGAASGYKTGGVKGGVAGAATGQYGTQGGGVGTGVNGAVGGYQTGGAKGAATGGVGGYAQGKYGTQGGGVGTGVNGAVGGYQSGGLQGAATGGVGGYAQGKWGSQGGVTGGGVNGAVGGFQNNGWQGGVSGGALGAAQGKWGSQGGVTGGLVNGITNGYQQGGAEGAVMQGSQGAVQGLGNPGLDSMYSGMLQLKDDQSLDMMVRLGATALSLSGHGSQAAALNSAQGLVHFIKTARSSVEQMAEGCQFQQMVSLTDQAYASVNTTVKQFQGKEPGKENIAPVINYMQELFNRGQDKDLNRTAGAKYQQLMGEMEHACQSAMHFSDLRDMLNLQHQSMGEMRDNIQGILGAVQFHRPHGTLGQLPGNNAANNNTIEVGGSGVDADSTNTPWVLRVDTVTSLGRFAAEQRDWSTMDTTLRESSSQAEGYLAQMRGVDDQLGALQKQMLIISTGSRRVAGRTEYLCPEGYPTLSGQDNPAVFMDYTTATPVPRVVCGYASPDRALQIGAQARAIRLSLGATERSVQGLMQNMALIREREQLHASAREEIETHKSVGAF